MYDLGSFVIHALEDNDLSLVSSFDLFYRMPPCVEYTLIWYNVRHDVGL